MPPKTPITPDTILPVALDKLFDKIKNGGIESLTPFEKGTLDNYSKN